MLDTGLGLAYLVLRYNAVEQAARESGQNRPRFLIQHAKASWIPGTEFEVPVAQVFANYRVEGVHQR